MSGEEPVVERNAFPARAEEDGRAVARPAGDLVGASSPTNTMSAGVMNSGTLVADFASQNVNVNMNFTLGANTFVENPTT